MKKIGLQLTIVFITALLTSSCAMESMRITQAFSSAIGEAVPPTLVKPKTPQAVVVCRSMMCAPSNTNMSREYIFNKLLQLLDNNVSSKLFVCNADEYTKSCINDFIEFDVVAGVTPGQVRIGAAKILDVQLKKGAKKINLVLDYDMYFNGIKPLCKPAQNILFAKTADYIVMEDTGYKCKLTTVSSSVVSHVYAIDYIDLDYGIIGAHYSIGMSGPAYGGGTGYMMFRFQNSAHPLNPNLEEPPKPAKDERLHAEIESLLAAEKIKAEKAKAEKIKAEKIKAEKAKAEKPKAEKAKA
ncbi:MAG: hypothetical protein KAJ75_07440, partial [Alphaproteobacteria bacterium]|nr:hypothetical protein [Alphaproteobacteria bacterium]